MCGIVGFISQDQKQYDNVKRHFMHWALALDTLRGRDSTGVIQVHGKFAQRMNRTLTPGDTWVQTRDFDKAFQPAWAMIGHNRSATAGSVTLENAHPFRFGPIRLVHNGTLWNNGKYFDSHDPQLEVDSMQIANALSQVSPKEATSILSKVDGSFALAWTDERDKSINLARNADRPLHVTVNATQDILFFMSDGTHLHAVNNSLYKSQAKGQTIYQIDTAKQLKYRKGSMVPEVIPFVPFDYKKASKSSQNSYMSDTSGKKRYESEDWKPPKTTNNTKLPSSTSHDGKVPLGEIRIEVGGKLRKLLPKHVGLLRSEFDLSPTEMLRLRPMEKIAQKNGRFTVIGEVYLPDWDCWWEAVLYDVPMLTINAYFNNSWYVTPTGVGRSWVEDDTPQPSILCKYHKAIVNIGGEGTKSPKGQTVRLGKEDIPTSQAVALLVRGCLSCEQPLALKDGPSVTIVNNGHDLLCMGCREDLNSRAAITTLGDPSTKGLLH